MKKKITLALSVVFILIINVAYSLPVLFQTKVYPLPATEYVIIQFFQQVGSVQALNDGVQWRTTQTSDVFKTSDVLISPEHQNKNL